MSNIVEIRKFMDDMGIPGRDLYEIPDSPQLFPDGAHCRTEIAGIERLTTLQAMINEMKSLDFVVHRGIATVGGATYVSFSELKEMAHLAREEKIEMVMTVGHRLGWDPGAKCATTNEGQQNGWRHRGSDNISYYLDDLMRCVDAGYRGFLIYDEAILLIVNEMRNKGFLPPETIFKTSVFAGYASAGGAKIVESMGANTFNPAGDLTLPMLAGIRKTVNIPLDVYVSLPDSFGGMFRAYEASEIARVAAPVYFKYEPGVSEGDMYKPWVSEEWHENHTRQKVKMAAIVQEIVGRQNNKIRFSEKGPQDMVMTGL